MALPLIATAGPVASVGTLLQSSLRLEREQWLSHEELASRRLTRLRQILAKAAKTSYYGAAMRAAGIDPAKAELRDLERMPVLDRIVIGKQGHRSLMTVDKTGLVQVRTSGSTGHTRDVLPVTPRGGRLLGALVAGVRRVRLQHLGLADQRGHPRQARPRGPDHAAPPAGRAAAGGEGRLGFTAGPGAGEGARDQSRPSSPATPARSKRWPITCWRPARASIRRAPCSAPRWR